MALNSNATYLPYRDTGAFSKIVNDYIDGAAGLAPYIAYTPNLKGIESALANRRMSKEHRGILVEELNRQYTGIDTSEKVRSNINALTNANAYTICTAHQPNLFTGHLYLVYKILHACRLADDLRKAFPETHFVPVFYMGSEDADLDELGQVTLEGKKLAWDTAQTGAVGRMHVDDKLLVLINEIEGQLSGQPFAQRLVFLLRASYKKGHSIEQATFFLLNELFQEYGLIVLLPDKVALKRLFIPTLKKELLEQFSGTEVSETIAAFPEAYKVQAAGRDLNLFYLKDDMRERIEFSDKLFRVTNTDLKFTSAEMMEEVELYPERFSPNVITRPLYQETILPNIAFIGGGAEIAYWLELKTVFKKADISFPVLILRNSFLIIERKIIEKIQALQLQTVDFFEDEPKLIARLVSMRSKATLILDDEKQQIASIYERIENISQHVDPTLAIHVQALAKNTLNRLTILEKKLLKVEKRKYEAEQRQVAKVRACLFPGGTLQERVDNVMPFYAMHGPDLLKEIYDASRGLDMQFAILEIT